VLAHGWQTIPERGVVRSRDPFKFWRASIIIPITAAGRVVTSIVSGAVNLGGRSMKYTGDGRRSPVYHTVHICVKHGGREAPRHAGLSAAAETCLTWFCKTKTPTKQC